MSFANAELYNRYIGRYGPGLARELIAAAGVAPGERAVDVGCGPGALTAALVEHGALVRAVDPSPAFAAACAERTGADVRVGRAEALPFESASADAVLSQLVMNFVEDAAAALGEMRRVVRPGGRIGALVWDYADGMTLLRAFWEAAAAADPRAAEHDEGRTMPLATAGELETAWRAAGLGEVRVFAVDVSARWEAFGELWSALEGGVGPSGAWVAGLDPAGRERLRLGFHGALGAPAGAFEVGARAWCAIGTAPGGSG